MVHKPGGKICLQGAVENANILVEQFTPVGGDLPFDEGLTLGEVLHFVVLPRFAANVL